MGNENRVLTDKNRLLKFIHNFQSEHEIEVSEWKHINNGKIRIRGATLDDHHACQSTKTPIAMTAEYMLKCVKEDKEIDKEVLKIFQENNSMNVNACFEVNLFQKCVVKPKFSLDEVVELSKVFPEVVNRIVKLCLKMTKWETENGSNKAS